MFVKIKSKTNAFFGLFILLVLFSVSCNYQNSNNIDIPELSVVSTVKVELKKLNDDLNSFGTMNYKTKNNVSVLVEGTLEKLYVKEGDYVKKGQVLASLRLCQI